MPYLPAGWTAEADGSIDNSNGGHKCEIVSPILRGDEGLAQVAEVLRTLEAKGHRVNASCGVHVHVGWKRDWPSEALARLVTIVAYVEKGLYAITGTQEPRARHATAAGCGSTATTRTPSRNLDRDRYHALNLTNLARGTKDTVEFRVFSGSLNATKVGRLDSGLPGIGRAGLEREADADLEPEAADRRMEEGRPRARAKPNA